MKLRLLLLMWVTMGVLIGCDGNTNSTKDGTKATVDAHNHEHEHEQGHDHDDDKVVDHSQLGHSHGAGPHGGVVADWGGGKYHVEILFDHAAKSATVFVFGGDEKTPVSIDATSIEVTLKEPAVSITLAAEAQANDTEGKASKFVGTHEALGKVQEFEGAITGVIDGTPYTGEFKE